MNRVDEFYLPGMPAFLSKAGFWVLLCVISILTTSPAFGQNRTLGEISGTVTDSAGARVPGAQVSLLDVLTGVETRVVTDDSGVYDANKLVPGTYTGKVTKDGFKTFLQENILLREESILVNAVLQVGSESQEVSVSATPTLLQTESAEQRTDISSELLMQLPNIGQTEFGYQALMAGVQPSGEGGSSNGLEYNGWVSINGTQSNTQNWTLDGGTRTVPTQGVDWAIVPPDATAEVNYITGNFGAEYGNGFAEFNVTSKSGTNQWHGSAFEYVQNNIFRARGHFSQPVPVLPYRSNEYGGTVGGPIKKNKAFFFFTYQYNPTYNGSPAYFTFPTPAMVKGDFSGLPVTLYDPNSLTLVNGVYTRTPLPGNNVANGTTPLDPVAQAIVPYIPVANFPSPSQSTCNSSGVLPAACFTNNFYWPGYTRNNTTWYLLRLDYDLSPNNRLNFTAMPTKDYNPLHNTPGAPLNVDRTVSGWSIPSQISDFWTVKPNLVNEARFSISYWQDNSLMADLNKGYMEKIGLAQVGDTSPVFPYLSWGGYASLSTFNNESFGYGGQMTYQTSDIATLTKGRHVFKFGGELDKYQYDGRGWNAENFSFSGLDTRNPALGSASVGLGWADFLYGGVGSFNLNPDPSTNFRAWTMQEFVQDDFKVKPSLTVNLGVRHVMISGWSEAYGIISNYDPYLANPTATYPQYAGGVCYGKSTPACPTVPKARLGNLAPRLGFAWEPRPNWSIRGGYGIYYQENSYQSFGASNKGKGWGTSGATPSSDNVHPGFQMSTGPAAYYIVSSAANRQPGTYNGQSLQYSPYNENFGFDQEWRLDIQRSIGQKFVADVAYVGTHGDKNPFTRSINAVAANLMYHNAVPGTNMNQYRPNPNFQSINTNINDGHSLYSGLQLGLRKEFTAGMSLLLNYTFSRTMDNGSSTGGNGAVNIDAIQNLYNLGANWARAINDTPSVFTAGIVYPIPVGYGKTFLNRRGVADEIIGGWRLSSVVMLHSGLPFTPTVGTGNQSGAIDGNWFPNVVGNPKIGGTVSANPTCNAPASVHKVSAWFNECAYVIPPAGQFGDSTRTSLRGPGMKQVDASISKSYTMPLLGEAGAFELKADAFNVFNHTNLLNPNASIGTAAAGIISSSQGARNMQFGAKFIF
jgi:hypothetical protein